MKCQLVFPPDLKASEELFRVPCRAAMASKALLTRSNLEESPPGQSGWHARASSKNLARTSGNVSPWDIPSTP